MFASNCTSKIQKIIIDFQAIVPSKKIVKLIFFNNLWFIVKLGIVFTFTFAFNFGIFIENFFVFTVIAPLQRFFVTASQSPITVMFFLVENLSGQEIEIDRIEEVGRWKKFHVGCQTLADSLAEVVIDIKIFGGFCFLKIEMLAVI